MQESLAEIEGKALPVVACHSYLSLYLMLRHAQLVCREGALHHFVELPSDEAQAFVHILGVATEVCGPQSRVGIAHHGTFYGVDKGVALP